MGLHFRRVLSSMLVAVLSIAPAVATACVVCCDPDVAHGAHTSAATVPSHGSHAAEPPPTAPKAGDNGAHCTQSADRVATDRPHRESPHTAPRIASQDRACSVAAVAPATVRAAARSDLQHTMPSLAAPVSVTWYAASQPSTAGLTQRPLFPPLSRSRTPLNLRI